MKLIGDRVTEYYWQTRGVGHTRAMMEGVGDKSIVVVVDQRQTRQLQSRWPGVNYMIVPDIGEKLHGLRAPLHIDNYAFTTIWAEARKALDEAESIMVELERGIDRRGP